MLALVNLPRSLQNVLESPELFLGETVLHCVTNFIEYQWGGLLDKPCLGHFREGTLDGLHLPRIVAPIDFLRDQGLEHLVFAHCNH